MDWNTRESDLFAKLRDLALDTSLTSNNSMRMKEPIAAEKKRLSAEYQTLLREMAEVCLRHDPVGINFEVNSDEYEPEVRTILPRLKACENSDEAVKVVHEEFQKWFGLDIAGPKERYLSLVEEIWHVWNERKSAGRTRRGNHDNACSPNLRETDSSTEMQGTVGL